MAFLVIRQIRSAVSTTIYCPNDGTPRGGVMCLHGSEGGAAGWLDFNCAMLAAHGFAAMAYRYTQLGPDDPSSDIDNVPLDRAEAALICLRQALPAGSRVALFGVSRGAEQALLLAQLLAEDGSAVLPDAVAVHSPPDATWPAYHVADFAPGGRWSGDPQRSAWSWRGSTERTQPGTPLEPQKFRGPVFIAQGTDDRVWDAAMARRLVARMTEAGRAPEAHFFAGEDHVFRAEARNREWELLLDFLGRHLTR